MADLRIAWFTPLQPVESGISLYSEALLPLLSKTLQIDAFVDNYRPTHVVESASLHVRPVREFRADQYDEVIYQAGNSPPHLYMLEHLARTPGILILHDVVLNHLFIQRAAQSGTLPDYRSEMERRYGAAGARAADRVLKGQAPDDLFLFPMSEQLVDGSKLTIVHSEFARQQVLNWCPEANVLRVAHGLHLPEYVDQRTARRALRIPGDQFVVASITHISPYKRLDVVLRAFRRLRREVPARLLLAGSVSPNYPIQRTVTHLGLDQVVDFMGYVTDQQARLIAAAADVIVNLRYPTAGETSGSLLHSMAAGRPVIVSGTGSFAEIPRDAVLSVPVDTLEENMLLAMLLQLARDPEFSNAIGTRAREFIEEEHSLQRWVDGYIDAIQHATGHLVQRPVIEVPPEPVMAGAESSEVRDADPLIQEVATAVAELGLGGDEELLREIAESSAELGLELGKMSE